jgi:endonuclease/exonuclease/phosphatase (EEP) superfamily protein YafD
MVFHRKNKDRYLDNSIPNVHDHYVTVDDTTSIWFHHQYHYENQIDQLEEFLRGLSGSIIVAGDFNTWNLWRDEKIDQVFARLGFAHLSPDNEHRNLVLDHVFVKGCQAHDFIVRDDISSSDHWPLQLNFDCSKSQESLLAKSAH